MASKPKYDEATTHHSERIYRDFEFFVKIFMGLVAAAGYIKLSYASKNEELARQAMKGVGALGMFTMMTLVVFIASHQGSKIRRWKKVEWDTIFFWQELWMMVSMYLMATALWIVAFLW